ncbi:nose resistant to fluoxetine protein 6-like [Oppia nitens]|uniref:nose resistant to fluoxetine protein 6-like n=1 Tax=Oppia nitens TaxID=1686743 RepID=UPI0023DCCCD8|nr:nose resistant to fluoxetine protein 6-like [Oppia nitens]
MIVRILLFDLNDSNVSSKPSLWSDVLIATQLYSRSLYDDYRQLFQLLSKSANVSQDCQISVRQTLDALLQMQDWAHQMVNSWGKFPASGLLEGTTTDLGSYDQCLSIKSNQYIGEPQYCMIDLGLPVPQPQPRHHNLNHRVDVLPHHFIKNISFANHLFTRLSKEASFFYWISLRTGICVPNKCTFNDMDQLTIKFYIFSLNKNIGKLLSPQTSETLSCLHGIRVLTIFWVVLGHTIVWVHFQMFSKSVNLNWFGFLISRIMRLTPQLALFLLFNFLLPLMGSGPIWHETIDKLINKCQQNWWLNLLYVQNFIDVNNMCAHHTWYTASDMQFHFLSLLIILAFLYNVRLGFIVNILTIITFVIISSVIIYVYDLPPAIVNTGRDQYFQDYYVELFYYKPWPHAIIFFTGLAFGFIVYRKMFFTLKTRTFYLIWATTLLAFWIPLMDDQFWNDGKIGYNPLVSALYYPFCRLVWALCIASMIWLCLSGNGGLVNAVLSWKAFVPLARLTYSVYLTHAWVVWIFYGTRRQLLQLSEYQLLLIFAHNLVFAYIVGAIFAIVFEMPILKCNKLLLQHFQVVPSNIPA